MKAAIYTVPGAGHHGHLTAFAEGLARHGYDILPFRHEPARSCDFAVVWGERCRSRIAERYGKPVLVLERGYIGDRFAFTSAGWDGLNGRAKFPEISDPARFRDMFSGLMKPEVAGDYALIMGQVEGDAALKNVNIRAWYRLAANALRERGYDVFFRQHPIERERRTEMPVIPGARPISGELADALDGAAIVATFNSTAGVDAALHGCHVHAEDHGSMVFDIASHDFAQVRGDREAHFSRLAWKQWSLEELSSGRAWELVGPVRGFGG